MAEATAEPFNRTEFNQLKHAVAQLEEQVKTTDASLTKLRETVLEAISLIPTTLSAPKTNRIDVSYQETPNPEVETPKPPKIIKHNRGHIYLHTSNIKDYIEAREFPRGFVVFMEIDREKNTYTSNLEFGVIPPPPKDKWSVSVLVANKDARDIWMMSVERNERTKCLEILPQRKELVITGTDAQLQSFLNDWSVNHRTQRLIVRWFGNRFDVPALKKQFPDIEIQVA